jgi:hypothetical protein
MTSRIVTFKTQKREYVVPIELSLCQEAKTLLLIAQECRDSQKANIDAGRTWAFFVNHRAPIEACLKGLCCLSLNGQEQLRRQELAFTDLKRMAEAVGDEPWGLRVSDLFSGAPIIADLNNAAHCNMPAVKRLQKYEPVKILADLDLLLSHLKVMVEAFESLGETQVIAVDDKSVLRQVERFHKERNIGKLLQMVRFYRRLGSNNRRK